MKDLNKVISFLTETKLPYYSSDFFKNKDQHTEHMQSRNNPVYAKAFEESLDKSGNHIEAHNTGIAALAELYKNKPWLIGKGISFPF